MNCTEFEILLTDYIDGALEPGAASRFGAHALRCRACRSILDDVKTKLRDDRPLGDLDTSFDLEKSLALIPSGRSSLECRRFEELITDFLDGFVPPELYRRFAVHSAECDSCSQLLTDVVYAVAACHSVHIYEEFDVPGPLTRRLAMVCDASELDLSPTGKQTRFSPLMLGISKQLRRLKPLSKRLAGWSALAAATVTLLLFDYSEDRTLGGVYRKAQAKAFEIYNQGLDFNGAERAVPSVSLIGFGAGARPEPPRNANRSAERNRGFETRRMPADGSRANGQPVLDKKNQQPGK